MKQLFNDNWQFSKHPLNTSYEAIHTSPAHWDNIVIPHDWMIEDTKNLYQDSIGCYKKCFQLQDTGTKQYALYFEGVYMNTTIYVNDRKAGEWKYGYTSFEIDITPFIVEGENTVSVHSIYQSPNTRWYSGAGIYRNVWLLTRSHAHLVTDGTYITTCRKDDSWTVSITSELINTSAVSENHDFILRHTLYDLADTSILSCEVVIDIPSMPQVSWADMIISPSKHVLINQQDLLIEQPVLWDLDNPYLYKLTTELIINNTVIDTVTNQIGFKTIRTDNEQGFFLNDTYVKLHGACQHHDLGSLGAAFNHTALRRQFVKLKAMGINSIRTSHNPPAPEFMSLADELGLLIVSEGYDMWERPKTEFDYGIYFNEWCERDTASWIRRDRNHPSIIMWSIGNEIYDTHQGRGFEITIQLRDYVLTHDPKRNGLITIGSNYIEWEGAQKCATQIDVSGYNYGERLYADHHKNHPEWCIYGSETSSTVQSRGIYHFPASNRLLTHVDLQCSSLGNCSTNWGAKNTAKAITDDRDAKFCLGQYIWTGWDYIGEPTPYFTKNSYFGQIDTAGFEKDTYYLYQAEWTDYKRAPMVHILPYWDYNIGQQIDIRIYSNAPKTELFFNDISQGIYEIDHLNGLQLSGTWQLSYAPGTIKAVAYDENDVVIAADSQSSFGDPVKIIMIPDKTECKANGQDLIFIELSTEDSNHIHVANARNRFNVKVSGAGRLVGLDNGDSTDYDQYKGYSRKLFSGKLLAIVAAGITPGEIKVEVTSYGLPAETLTLNSITSDVVPGVSCWEMIADPDITIPDIADWDIIAQDITVPVRKISLTNLNSNQLNKDNYSTSVVAEIFPENATYHELTFKALMLEGIESNCARITQEGTTAIITALGDGAFRLCCSCNNGADHPEIISELEFQVSGLGKPTLDPYHMVSACQYTSCLSTPDLSFEGGAFTLQKRNWFTFESVDFGEYGSDEITLPIFSFDTELPLEVWEGNPDKDGKLLLAATYHSPSLYNHYQSNTYKLPKRLTGLKTISIVTFTGLSLQGFYFKYYEKAYATLNAIEHTRITGDTFTLTAEAITGIGNNVSIEFSNMDFKMIGFHKLILCGRSHNEVTTIHVCFHGIGTVDEPVDSRQIAEFKGNKDYTEQIFELNPVFGLQNVDFTFLPGSNFDFKWFRFE